MSAAVAVLALLAGACADGDDGAARLSRPVPLTTSTAPVSPSTSSTSTTSPSPTSTTSAATQVVLGPDGLGLVAFGDRADQVVVELTGVLGPPSDDRPLGSCPSGEVERLVEFAELAVSFGGSGDGEGTSRLVAWDVGPPSGALPPLTTAEGVGVGTTVAELRRAYGDRVDIGAVDPFGPGFEIQVPVPGRLTGTLSGTGANDTVATLAGGAATCAE